MDCKKRACALRSAFIGGLQTGRALIHIPTGARPLRDGFSTASKAAWQAVNMPDGPSNFAQLSWTKMRKIVAPPIWKNTSGRLILALIDQGPPRTIIHGGVAMPIVNYLPSVASHICDFGRCVLAKSVDRAIQRETCSQIYLAVKASTVSRASFDPGKTKPNMTLGDPNDLFRWAR